MGPKGAARRAGAQVAALGSARSKRGGEGCAALQPAGARSGLGRAPRPLSAGAPGAARGSGRRVPTAQRCGAPAQSPRPRAPGPAQREEESRREELASRVPPRSVLYLGVEIGMARNPQQRGAGRAAVAATQVSPTRPQPTRPAAT